MTLRFPPLLTINELLKLYHVRAMKKLSQNFLLDLKLTDKIVKSAKDLMNCEVCEVGPGPGGISRSVLKSNPSRLIVIEKDKRFIPILESLAESSYCQFDIILADIIDFDLSKIFSSSFKKNWDDDPPNLHIIGNLPFNVSTPLIIKWLRDISLKRSAWSLGRVTMTLTFQEEVGMRMIAPAFSESRCRLSVMCQNWCDIIHKFVIPGRAFLPKPEVNVSVVHFEPLVKPLIDIDFNFFEKFLRTVFNTRQKFCSNAIQHLFPVEVTKTLTKELLALADINGIVRPFQLTIEEWGRLCFAYKTICDRDPTLASYDFRNPIQTREKSWKIAQDVIRMQ